MRVNDHWKSQISMALPPQAEFHWLGRFESVAPSLLLRRRRSFSVPKRTKKEWRLYKMYWHPRSPPKKSIYPSGACFSPDCGPRPLGIRMTWGFLNVGPPRTLGYCSRWNLGNRPRLLLWGSEDDESILLVTIKWISWMHSWFLQMQSRERRGC